MQLLGHGGDPGGAAASGQKDGVGAAVGGEGGDGGGGGKLASGHCGEGGRSHGWLGFKECCCVDNVSGFGVVRCAVVEE